MCDFSPNREAAMVTVVPGIPERHGRDGVWCDPCLAPLIRALNEGGIRTTSSCCGHGTHYGMISLDDGRWLAIMPDDEAAFDRFDSRIPGMCTTEDPCGRC